MPIKSWRQRDGTLIISAFVSAGDQSILLLYLMYEPREFTTALFGVFNSVRMLLLVSGLV